MMGIGIMELVILVLVATFFLGVTGAIIGIVIAASKRKHEE